MMKNKLNIGLGCVLAFSTILPVSFAQGQASAQGNAAQGNAAQGNDPSSLADYARRVRKDTGGAKAKPKVFDNDNLPKDDKLSVVGQQQVSEAKAPAVEDAAEKSATPADGKTPAETKTQSKASPMTSEEEKAKKQADWKTWQDKISAQRDQVTLASRELDVTSREYQIRAAAMYADVGNRLRNSGQWDKEEATYKQQIADKQKALDDAKQKLEGMKDDAAKAGVPASMTE